MDDKTINLNWLDDLTSRADIVSVVGSYVPLSRRGGRYWACCPFHAERTPSFTVDETTGLWYCFGACHEGGNVINFEMKINNISFHDAVKRLAARVGMKLPEKFGSDVNAGKKDKLYDMMIEAARYYRSCLQNSDVAKKYLASRGISEKTTAIFGLGYSPDYNGLITALTEKGFSRKDMYDCSLLGERDGQYYDFQAGRLIVPIFDAFGKVIGFGGRVLEKKEGVAKYKNSRENILFDKKRVLYGLNYVKKAKIGNPIEDIILVEGYMDVIGLYQAGVKNAVASMGTSLTEIQAKTLKSMVDKVIICYDGDFAGQKSTLRGLDILKRHDLEVRVMSLPDGKDPDEMVRDGVEPFLKCKKEALPLYEFLLKKAEEGLDLDSPSGKTDYVKRAVAIIADMEDMERTVYVQTISKRSGVKEGRINSYISTLKNSPDDESVSNRKAAKLTSDNNAEIQASRYVLYYILQAPSDSSRWVDDVDWFVDETHKNVYKYVLNCVSEGRNPTVANAYLLDNCEKEEIDRVFGFNQELESPKAYFEDCCNRLKKKFLEERRNELLALHKAELDADKASAISDKIKEIQAEIILLKNKNKT
ncbi:MAG: DNA primase [Clostridia bacterium]|nr:DNA primase [Clostridia bacterium]